MALVTTDEIMTFLGAAATDTALVALFAPQVQRLIKNFVGYNIEQASYTQYYPNYRASYPVDPLVDGYEMWGGKAVPVQRFADDRRVLMLVELPVRTITAVWENPGAWDNGTPDFPDSTMLSTVDYQLDTLDSGISWTGFVYRRSGIWQNVPRAIKVTYTAGLTSGELADEYSDFRLAALVACQTWYGQIVSNRINATTGAAGGVVVGESLQGWSISYDGTASAQNYGYGFTLPQTALKLLEDRISYAKYMG